MHTNVDTLFEALWQDYLAITPSAKRVHQLLGGKDSQASLVNDHIALRTFDHSKINLDKLAEHFLSLGYQEKGQYEFKAKKVTAKHFEHSDLSKPKVFISELLSGQLSEQAQTIINRLVAQVADDISQQHDFLYSGRPWQISTGDYQALIAESEYAGWMSAWGFRANHFTVSVNHLSDYQELAEVNEALKRAGFALNTSGGEIKGGPDVYLAQSSTMADKVDLAFSDSHLSVPSCFYEFAQRYVLPNGELYQGFVAASADKIFESTNAN